MTTYRLLPGSSEPSRKRSTRMRICWCATRTARVAERKRSERPAVCGEGQHAGSAADDQPDSRGMDHDIADLTGSW
jgi:hypothetical protein